MKVKEKENSQDGLRASLLYLKTLPTWIELPTIEGVGHDPVSQKSTI